MTTKVLQKLKFIPFSPGDIAILGHVQLTMNYNGFSPWFTLTIISTGGPVTNVTWTRDSDTVTEGSETVLDDQEIAQYTHSLIVTDPTSFNGTYGCIVSNTKPSSASFILNTTVIQSEYSVIII